METAIEEKLNTGADWVNSEILSQRTARIKGISRNYEIGYNDLVLFDPVKKIITQIINTDCLSMRPNIYMKGTDRITTFINKMFERNVSPFIALISMGIAKELSTEEFLEIIK